MVAANQTPTQQPVVQDITAAPTPPTTPGDMPAEPEEGQPPANVLHGVQMDPPENMATDIHPLPAQDAEPVVAPNVPAVLGASPLLRSLYGRRFGN